MTQYSFDVFDTVLTRLVLDPRDVFRLVQNRMDEIFPSSCFRKYFWEARVWAEFLSRRRTSAQDVTLAEIYHIFVHRFGMTQEQADHLKELELKVEESVLVPIGGVADRLHHCRKISGKGIFFISDMYLPANFIVAQLAKYGLFLEGDHLFVSGDIGLTKGSGDLFRKVLEDFSLDPEELIHFGDHPRSDVQVPRSLGIRVMEAGQDDGWRASALGAFWGRVEYLLSVTQALWRLERNGIF